MRAISASTLHLRTNQIYVNSDEIKESGITYVMPKNLLKKFICISDLRIQVAGLLYGVTPEDNDAVREIKCIVMVPQVGSYQSVTLPSYLPDHAATKDMEPLGWLHTQPNETGQLAAIDATTHAKMLSSHAGWDAESSVIGTCSFTQGSCSLSVYKLTPKGLEWAQKNQRETAQDIALLDGHTTDNYERVQIILSDKFLGFFLVPSNGGIWNYNFNGINFNEDTMKFALTVDTPKEFYHELHRAQHFLDFVRGADDDEDETADTNVDLEDNFN